MTQVLDDTTTRRLPDREAMLDVATEHILEVGLVDTSLRSLGRAMGVSARMLVYHFGSKDDLVREVLERIRQGELREMDDAMRAATPDERPSALLDRSWTPASRPESLRYVRLNAEISVLGLESPESFGAWRDRSRAQWTELTDSALARRPLADPRLSGLGYLIHTTMHGLLRDLASGYDPDTVEAGRRAFGALLDAADPDTEPAGPGVAPPAGLVDWVRKVGRAGLSAEPAAEGVALQLTADTLDAADVRTLVGDAAEAGAATLTAGGEIADLRVDHLGPADGASLVAHVILRSGATSSYLDITVNSGGSTIALGRARLA